MPELSETISAADEAIAPHSTPMVSRDPWVDVFLAILIASKVQKKLDHEFRQVDSILRERLIKHAEQWGG